MNKLTEQEFQDRISALTKARKIFIPHMTKNISIAFELYQKVLAKQKQDIFLNTAKAGRAPRTWLDKYERPECPECGEVLYLRSICGKGIKQHGNLKGWKTCWECLGPRCMYEAYSRKSIGKWMKRLRRKKDA